MGTRGKSWWLFTVAVLIFTFAFTAFFGVSNQYGDTVTTYFKGAKDIRFGVDIRGGVNVTFMPTDGFDATDEQMEAAQSVIENRLVGLNVTDYEIYVDMDKDRIILEFPWQAGEADFDPEVAIEEIGTTAHLTFRQGAGTDGELIMDGANVDAATAAYGALNASGASEYYVALDFDEAGASAFATATGAVATLPEGENVISIWLDDANISTASVSEAITGGEAVITSANFTQEQVVTLARQINSGALPFALTVDSYSTQSPTLGENSLGAMVIAGIIAFALIAIIMTLLYRLPGFIACIALLGQVSATLAVVSGYLPIFPSFTLTLPGIAGIILAVGMGVDANVITAERIKEEFSSGKSLTGALKSGFARGLAPIIDGNITIVIVSVVLMGAFGPTDGFFAKVLSPIFFAFGPATAGAIYAFGYTLLVGVLLNFVFGVFATRVMIKGAAAIKALRNPWLYGGKNAEVGEAQKVAEKEPFPFAKYRKRFVAIELAILAVILVCTAVFGVKLDTEFTGGAIITLGYEGNGILADATIVAADILEEEGGEHITPQLGEIVGTEQKTITFTMPGTETVTVEQVQELVSTLQEKYPDNNYQQLSLNNVSPTMGAQFFQKSLVAVALALVLILIYIALRFKNIGGLTGGMMSIIALVSDLMIVFGTFIVLRTALDGNFIAAMLTILGYSINDTVVVYDRIRENRKLYGKKMPFTELVNLSINQSKRRTFVTTLTTVVALGVMCVISQVYALDSIFTFVFPLMMGMLSGVFTSLCVSTSCWMLWAERKSAKK